jgi:FkbM family methyltransferase
MGFVLAASRHGPLLVPRFDYHSTGGPAFGVGNQILEHGAWDPQEMGVLLFVLRCRRQQFGDGVVLLDCGANIAVLTVEAAVEMTGWGSVLAIEAQARLFYALAGNIALNNCFNARALHAAVAGADGTLRVPVPDYLSAGSYGSLELRARPQTEFIGQAIDYSEAATQPIRMLKLDSLGLDRVDVLKVDVEGMEAEVLLGGLEAIAKCRPIMLVEWIKSSKSQLRSIFESLGYRIFEGGMNLLAVHADDGSLAQIEQNLTAARVG